MKPIFEGTCTALVTPFEDQRINFTMFRQLLERQISKGINAVVVCGTTGESATLTDEEKMDLYAAAVDCVRGRIPVIAGTGSNCTKHSIYLSKIAEKLGVDGLLLVSPYYNKTTDTGLVEHYRAIADSVSLPCILYNVPSRTGMDISVNVCKELAQHPNIHGIKEASGNISKVVQLRSQCPKDFYIWSGNDDQTVPIMSMGGKGVISVLSNLYPEEMTALSQLCLNNRYEAASRLQAQLWPYMDAMFCEVNPIPIKAAMKLEGYDCGSCRLPLVELSEKNQTKLEALLY